MALEPAERGLSRKIALRAAIALVLLLAVVFGLVSLSPERLYLWIKALHIMAVISWMAGLFYLPRLFIYHSDAAIGSEMSETFKIMERRLYRIIMTPAMVLSWVFGLVMAWSLYHFQGGWLHLKLALVVLMTASHFYFGRAIAVFAADGPRKSTRHWRLMNEVPTLLMIAIVILVVVQPF